MHTTPALALPTLHSPEHGGACGSGGVCVCICGFSFGGGCGGGRAAVRPAATLHRPVPW